MAEQNISEGPSPATYAAMVDLGADRAVLLLESYRQNMETFRSLNSLMWQIPLIAMTLTGGLWFGVSKVQQMPQFRDGLLLLAGLGNLGLCIVLNRLRYIMGRYLEWLEAAFPEGHVSAPGDGFFSRKRRVKQVFTALLLFASGFSFLMLVRDCL